MLTHHAMQARLLRVVRRGVLARGAARRCRAGRHAAPASKPRYGLRGAEPRRNRASAGGLAAAWRRMTPGDSLASQAGGPCQAESPLRPGASARAAASGRSCPRRLFHRPRAPEGASQLDAIELLGRAMSYARSSPALPAEHRVAPHAPVPGLVGARPAPVPRGRGGPAGSPFLRLHVREARARARRRSARRRHGGRPRPRDRCASARPADTRGRPGSRCGA